MIWSLAWFGAYAVGGGMAWHFFVQGQQAITDLDNPVTGGVHLYAGLPQLQIGPLPLVTAWLFSRFGPRPSLLLAQVFSAAAGVLILWLVERLAQQTRPDLTAEQIRWRIRLAGFFFAPVWLYLAVASVHLDDVLTLLFGVLASVAAQRRKAALTGLLLGLAVDSKPWAVPFAIIVLMLPGARARAGALATLIATVGACWLPFLVLDPHTLNAIRFTIANTPRTALRVLGINSPRTPPWDRPAQTLLGLLLGAIAWHRGRWAAVILLTVAARIVLDPGTNLYYSAGAVVGAALWDIAGSSHRFPWWTMLTSISLFDARHVGFAPSVNGWLTLGVFAACTAFLVVSRIEPRGIPQKSVQEILRRSSRDCVHDNN